MVQGDHINESRIGTAICVLLTSNLKWGVAPTNLKLPSSATGLLQDSIAQTTHILAVDKRYMIERIGRISQRQLEQLFACLDIALGRSGG